jgi:hypothetical protein
MNPAAAAAPMQVRKVLKSHPDITGFISVSITAISCRAGCLKPIKQERRTLYLADSPPLSTLSLPRDHAPRCDAAL